MITVHTIFRGNPQSDKAITDAVRSLEPELGKLVSLTVVFALGVFDYIGVFRKD